jgi:hypothetical protein
VDTVIQWGCAKGNASRLRRLSRQWHAVPHHVIIRVSVAGAPAQLFDTMPHTDILAVSAAEALGLDSALFPHCPRSKACWPTGGLQRRRTRGSAHVRRALAQGVVYSHLWMAHTGPRVHARGVLFANRDREGVSRRWMAGYTAPTDTGRAAIGGCDRLPPDEDWRTPCPTTRPHPRTAQP